MVHEPVSYVNAPVIAKERGLGLSETIRGQPRLREPDDAARRHRGRRGGRGRDAGGQADAERLTQVYGFDVDMAPAKYMAFFLYEDRPGVIGTVGTLLGDAGVNIASMEVGRKEQGGRR